MTLKNENNFDDAFLDFFMGAYEKLPSDDKYYYFYKYFSFDTSLHVLNTLRNCELKYTKPRYFNDPFDCLYHVNLDFSNFNKKNFEAFMGISISSSQWLKNKNRFIADMKNSLLTGFIHQMRDTFAVTCFTSTPKNILMWSHYANNHEGFVIEFSYPKLSSGAGLFSKTQMLLPVKYTNDFPILDLNWNVTKSLDEYSVKSDIISKILLYKAKCWEYEQEFRIVTESKKEEGNALILRSFSPTTISSIILGANIRKDHKLEITKALAEFNLRHEANIKLFQARIDSKKYEINIPKHPRLSQFST